MSAPAVDEDGRDSSEYLTVSDIAGIRSTLKEIPGMSKKSIDDFIKVMETFGKNSTEDQMIEGVVSILSISSLSFITYFILII